MNRREMILASIAAGVGAGQGAGYDWERNGTLHDSTAFVPTNPGVFPTHFPLNVSTLVLPAIGGRPWSDHPNLI